MICKKLMLGVALLLAVTFVNAQSTDKVDGYALWFSNTEVATAATHPTGFYLEGKSDTRAIITAELQDGLSNLFGTEIKRQRKVSKGILLLITPQDKLAANYLKSGELDKLEEDGFLLKKENGMMVIAANTEIGLLYGTFHYLRLLRTGEQFPVRLEERPKFDRRILNHWDNLDRTVERGYAGRSLWQWDELPSKVDERYQEYAKANASVGINGTVLNNVNANPMILSEEYLIKVKSLADVFRPYGLKVYLSINFSSPAQLGGLPTSDPLDEQVIEWWQQKVAAIYKEIPDFGGFLVKANSEGLPGPQDFGRTHAEGANMLADALAPYHGIVMWRAFVYNPTEEDRAKQAYNEFLPLDGQFRKNVIVQVKNGPVDFQPREPFSPLFGRMQNTTLMPELQVTQEYLGFSNHLVYLGTLFKEFLDADTYAKGRNTPVSSISDGTVFKDSITAIAGVANIGSDPNWCGHHFAQSNWYAYGRLAWNHQLPAHKIAAEWLKQTFTTDQQFVNAMSRVMMESREATVNYMTPLGLHHLMGWGHHYGPEPWCAVPGARPDWMPSYYHKADINGIGFNRSSTGSNATAQYFDPLKSMYDNPQLCPEEYLLWFHHLPWDYTLHNGKTLWTELCYRYSEGVDQVKVFQDVWRTMKGKVDEQRYQEVESKLETQLKEASWWRDACLLYFQTFSQQPIPSELARPVHQLEDLKKLKFDMKHHN
ncbi:alpha-glucuronidase family glycosyl hydrolase [Limibacter armeniacum]|uniref:alpha-glucuronidase family glycosyl hydrolase n=1 Tax=Limibacter armeniacum TaxID=466084 RepID=UPI002FE6859E